MGAKIMRMKTLREMSIIEVSTWTPTVPSPRLESCRQKLIAAENSGERLEIRDALLSLQSWCWHYGESEEAFKCLKRLADDFGFARSCETMAILLSGSMGGLVMGNGQIFKLEKDQLDYRQAAKYYFQAGQASLSCNFPSAIRCHLKIDDIEGAKELAEQIAVHYDQLYKKYRYCKQGNYKKIAKKYRLVTEDPTKLDEILKYIY